MTGKSRLLCQQSQLTHSLTLKAFQQHCIQLYSIVGLLAPPMLRFTSGTKVNCVTPS
jgi:hypothetical protein